MYIADMVASIDAASRPLKICGRISASPWARLYNFEIWIALWRQGWNVQRPYNLVSKAVKDRELIYDGDPETIREYIHVKDATRSSVEILSDEFRNTAVLLTGAQQTRMNDLLRTLGEMLNLETDIQFSGQHATGHYVRTPYSFQPDVSRKFVGNSYIDFGEDY